MVYYSLRTDMSVWHIVINTASWNIFDIIHLIGSICRFTVLMSFLIGIGYFETHFIRLKIAR